MERLKVLRKKEGYTQADVAAKLGIDRSTYAKYETGQSEPNFEMLQKLSDLFHASIEFLIMCLRGSDNCSSMFLSISVVSPFRTSLTSLFNSKFKSLTYLWN